MHNYIVRCYTGLNVQATALFENDFANFNRYGLRRRWLYPELADFIDVRNHCQTIELNTNYNEFIYYYNNKTYMWLEAEDWFDAIIRFSLVTKDDRKYYSKVCPVRFKPYKLSNEIDIIRRYYSDDS